MRSPITLLLNWHITAYHAPILLASSKGFFAAEGLDVALMEPLDPSDVTKVVGTRKVDFALKALVHCFAARERGYPITAVASIFDEPPTGILSIGDTCIRTLTDLKGKRIGFVGEFGKVMIEDIAKKSGLLPTDVEMIRVGMHGVDHLLDGRIDGMIGINCIQGVELSARTGSCHILRIDDLAHLGCCCFCSIALICHDEYAAENGPTIEAMCRALFKAVQFTVDYPEESLEHLKLHWPRLRSSYLEKSFHLCLPYFARHLENIPRDWEKVAAYATKLGILHDPKDQPYTNRFLPHEVVT